MSRTRLVSILEGLPHHANVAVSLRSHGEVATGPLEHNFVMLVRTLPFAMQCAMYWNVIGLDHTPGVRANEVYGADSLAYVREACRDLLEGSIIKEQVGSLSVFENI